MFVFHHKIRKPLFLSGGVPLILLVQIGVGLWILAEVVTSSSTDCSAASLRLENRKSSLENLKQYYIDNLYYTKYNIGIRTVLKRKQHRKERLDGI